MKPALFRIRDASGNWVEIPALIGRKGDPGTPATHRWEGTTLYITSENGTTSANLIGPQGEKGEKGEKGDPFTIAKVYDSVEAMNRGYATDGVPVGGFVAIETGDVNDEDNAKLYIKGTTDYEYLTDLSGAQGLTGPQGEQGPRGEQGPTGDSGVFVGSADGTPPATAQVWIVADGDYGHVEKWKFTPADGEPIEKNIIVPPDQALVGIKFRTENGGWVEVPALVGKDGENGISVTHAWNGTVLTLTSASGTTMTDLVGPQGDRGPKGDPGERGERGYNGVHVGSDDPPEGTNVWIDTGGDYGYIEEWEFTKEGSNEVIPKKVIVPPENAIVGLRLKQPDGTWVDVPALIGEKGDKGDKGETGNNGIHVGDKPPTDESIEVWVDTSEDVALDNVPIQLCSINNGIRVYDSGLSYSRGIIELRKIGSVLWLIDCGVHNFTDSFTEASSKNVLEFELPKELSNRIPNVNGAFGTTGTIGYFPALAYENVTYSTFNCQSYLKRQTIGDTADTYRLVYTGLSAIKKSGGLCGFHLKMPILLY